MPEAACTEPTGPDIGFSSVDIDPLGATIYIEVIIVDPTKGRANLPVSTTCTANCDTFSGFNYYRDLVHVVANHQVQNIIALKGRKRANYTPYYRDYNTNTLRPASYSDLAVNRRSLVFINKSLTEGQLRTALEHLGTHREILPSRMTR